jgi:hypothetical protein
LHLGASFATYSEDRLAFPLIEGLSVVETLELGDITDTLHQPQQAEVFLQMVLSKPIYGSWLANLAGLKNLECFWMYFRSPPTVKLTGTQLAAFFGLPKLISSKLHLFEVDVVCSPEEKLFIDTCMAKMEKAGLGEMTLTVQQLS